MVFCEDCKYLYRDLWDDNDYRCSKEKTIENTFLRPHIKHPLAEERNKNNDCGDYEKYEKTVEIRGEQIETETIVNDSKRKWWKFWVK